VPYLREEAGAVWIEIDRAKLEADKFVSGSAMIDRWKSDNAHKHNFMPLIEAVHLGPLPRTAFKRAFLAAPKGDIRLDPVAV
jgi:hypothetical protein